VHGVMVVALLTVVQVAWLGVIAFAAYRLL
jgi:hypothetical protein